MPAALLVIDVQQALLDELASERREEFVGTLQRLLKSARAAACPVIYVRHDGAPAELIFGTPEWKIAADIQPLFGEPIVDKRFRDAFRDTTLAALLTELRVDELLVCGMHTEFCVDATVREAERRGYRVTLIEDAHATLPGGGLSEEQIRTHMHRVARDKIAQIVPSSSLFQDSGAITAQVGE